MITGIEIEKIEGTITGIEMILGKGRREKIEGRMTGVREEAGKIEEGMENE